MNQKAIHTDRSDENDIDVPDFGPAEQAEADTQTSANRSVEVVYRGGDSWVTTLILALLTTGCAVLGYLAFDLQSTLMDQRKLLTESGAQLEALEARLAEAQNSSAASGKTLQEQLTSLSSHVSDLDQTLDQGLDQQNTLSKDVARLNESLNAQQQAQQGVEGQLSEHAKTLTGLSEASNAQQALITPLKAQVTQMQSTLTSFEGLTGRLNDLERSSAATLEVAQQQVATNQAVLGQLKAQMATLEDSTRTLQSQLLELKESTAFSSEQSKGDLERRFASLEASISKVNELARQAESVAGRSSQQASALGKQVRVHEQAINAIDGTRRQVNSELLTIRDQLNALSLKLN